MNAHNYGPDDFATYSQDPQWRELHHQAFPDYEMPPLNNADSPEIPQDTANELPVETQTDLPGDTPINEADEIIPDASADAQSANTAVDISDPNPTITSNEQLSEADENQNNDLLGLRKADSLEILEKEHINKDILPEADTQMTDHIKDNGLDKYISDDKLQVKLTDNTEALTPAEMKAKYGKNWNPGIMGFNNGKKSYVDSSYGPEQAKETAIHENFHQLSANDKKGLFGRVRSYRRGLSIDGNDRGLNEALTQKYTLDTMRDTDPSYVNPNCLYDEASKYIDDIYSYGNNKEMFDQAYFQNNPDALKQHFDQYCGTGFFDDLSYYFDVATDNSCPPVARKSALNQIGNLVNQYTLKRLLSN